MCDRTGPRALWCKLHLLAKYRAEEVYETKGRVTRTAYIDRIHVEYNYQEGIIRVLLYVWAYQDKRTKKNHRYTVRFCPLIRTRMGGTGPKPWARLVRQPILWELKRLNFGLRRTPATKWTFGRESPGARLQ